MTPDTPHTPREELEARLTALLLGELAADEAAALRHTIEQDPELARLESQLKETIGLVRQAAASKDEKPVELAAPLQLSAERREKLLASFKTTRLEMPKKPLRKLKLNRELLKLAAMVVALVLVGGVVVSYFTNKSMKQMALVVGDLDLAGAPADDAEQAKAAVVTVLAGSAPVRGRVNQTDLPASIKKPAPASERWEDVAGFLPPPATAINKPAPASGTRTGQRAGGLGGEYATEGGLERSKAQILAQMPARSAQTPPPPPASRAPAKALPQVAQAGDRFRTTIALPTSSEPQPPGAIPSDSVGELVDRTYFAGVPEQLREESNVRTRSELAGGPGGFGGGAGLRSIPSGGGGLGGGGRGPVAASEGKEAGRVPEVGEIPTVGRLFQAPVPGKPQQLGGLADAKTAGQPGSAEIDNVGNVPQDSIKAGNLGPGDMGGPAFGWAAKESLANKPLTVPLQGQPADGFGAKDVNGTAPAITANPVPAVDPATGLPVASPVAGTATSSIVLGDTGVEVVRRRVGQAVNPTEPVPSAANTSPDAAWATLGFDGKDIKRPASAKARIHAPSVIPSTGLPVEEGAVEGASVASRAPKPDAAKTTSFPDDVDILLKPQPNAVAVRPLRPTTPSPSIPAATPVPALESKEKNTASMQSSIVIDSAQNYFLTTNAVIATTIALGSTANDGLGFDHGQHFAGVQVGDLTGALITDPTHGTGDGREWGIRQKLDGDGSPGFRFLTKPGQDQTRVPQTAEAELERLADLTQPLSKKKALNEVQDKLAKVERGGGGAGQVYSVDAVGYVNQTARRTNMYKPPPVADEERKKESEIAGAQTVVVQRSNASAGQVTVDYSSTEGAAKFLEQVLIGVPVTLENSKRSSAESLSRKSRVEIALPPGGENVQGVEREPRVQAGPVVISEIQYHSPEEQKRSFANRLNQSVNRAASGAGDRIQISGQAEEADVSVKRFGENLGEKQAELERLSKLNQSLQSATLEDLRKTVTTASPDPELASVFKGLSVEVKRRGLLQGEQAGVSERNRYKHSRELDELNGELDKRLEELRSNVKARLEQLQTEVAREKPQDLAKLKYANLSQALDEYGRLSGRTVLRAGALPSTGGITVESATPLADKDALNVLDTVLAMNQIATTFQGTNYVKAVPAPQAAREAEKFNDVPLELLPEAEKPVTHVVQLKNALPNEVQQVLQPFAKLPQSIITIPNSSMIVMRDKPENVARMVEMVKRIDVVPVQEFVDVTFPLKTAPAADVARMLQNSAATGELAAAGRAKIIADERTNALLIFAGKEDLNSISNAIRRLDAPIPQGEVEAAENAFSTFSLNVSDVSFKLAAASLEKGQMPDRSTVRSEEFINAFDYRDPEPKGSAPIAFAWERARYPFAHNRDLLRFSVKTAASGRQPGRPLNLVLLLDNSGSMERADRVRVIRECIRVLAGQLQPQDRVSVVAFARTARLWVDGLAGSQAAELPKRVGDLAPDGGTNLEDAMNVAYQAALKHFLPNGVNRVVLLTDGAANLGDVEPESLKKKVETHRKQGVALDCFGIGWDGYNDDLLEVLSRNGDGRYGFVNTPEAAASEFAGQLAGALRVAASDVKVQVQFNPRRVTAWRQIGYAKHQLKKEQFRDNTVDAAEIGAAEQGNALYTVQVNPNGEGPIGVVRVRFKVPGTSDYREHEWAVPYSGAAMPLEQCSPALRLAASASAFSEWLVSSPFAAEVTPDRLLGYLSGVPETCAADPRPKKLEWMIRQAKSLSGK